MGVACLLGFGVLEWQRWCRRIDGVCVVLKRGRSGFAGISSLRASKMLCMNNLQGGGARDQLSSFLQTFAILKMLQYWTTARSWVIQTF